MRKLLAVALILLGAVGLAQTFPAPGQFPAQGTTGAYLASSGAAGGVFDLEDGLWNWWKFESGPGYVGSIRNHSWNGGVGTVAGKSGNGISVQPGGGSGIISTTHDFLGAWPRGVTCTFWVNATSYTDSGAGSPIMVSTSSSSGWDLFKNAGATTIRLNIYGGGGTTTVTGNPLPTGAWHFVVIQCPSGGPGAVCNVRINMGAPFQTAATSINGGVADSFLLSYNIAGHGIVGTFDEMGLWNRALSVPELQHLYNGGAGNFYPF